jgi:hypothetical protein
MALIGPRRHFMKPLVISKPKLNINKGKVYAQTKYSKILQQPQRHRPFLAPARTNKGPVDGS